MVALVLGAACLHATWNLLAKRAADAGAAFVAAYTIISAAVVAPVAAWALWRHGLPGGWLAAACILLSGLVHSAYGLVLQRAYRAGDLSVVYPVARGTGPLLAALGAMLLLGETPTPFRVAGLLLVVGGILLLASGGRLRAFADPAARPGVAWGGATGAAIAAYTVIDGWGVKVVGLHPVVLDWCGNLVRLALLLPGVLRAPSAFRARMQGHWWRAAGVGVLGSAGYIMVLTALDMGAPLSAVAPMREMSMMVGALLGMALLGERVTPARLTGCALIVAGVALLAR